MVLLLTLPFALLLPSIVSAANDWTTACHSGECSYELHNQTTTGPIRAILTIAGSNSSVSDLTPAAGWQILDCDSSSATPQIRAVCTGTDEQCAHLYNNGAENTIVRLPESCGNMPFARIVSEWSHENQTIPANVTNQSRRRADQPTVRGLSLDTNFHEIDPKHHGTVAMFVQGINSNGTLPATNGTSTLERRSLWDSIKNAASSAANAVKQAAGDVSNTVNKAIGDIEQTFSDDKSTTQAINFNSPITIIDKYASCASSSSPANYRAGIKVSATPNIHASVNYGVVASGTVVPPSVNDFAIFATLDGDIGGTVTVDVIAGVSLDTGLLELFQVGLPALSFPGVLTIGPSFVLNARAYALLEADMEMNVDLAYTISGAKMYFPPNKGSSGGQFAPANTNLGISANPAVVGTGTIQAHIVPQLTFGVSAFNSANVDIYLSLDASAGLELSLAESLQGGFAGCADVETDLTVKAGASAQFFTLFNQGTYITLFEKTWELWQKCFGSRRREHPRSLINEHQKRLTLPGGISCQKGFGSASGVRSNLVSEMVNGGSI